MTVEITRAEAEVLIAIMTGAEGVFPMVSPELAEALAVLRPWRSRLIHAYLNDRIGCDTEVADAET